MDKQTQIMVFYLVLIVAMAWGGNKWYGQEGMIGGGVAGVVVSWWLWENYGKKMVEGGTGY